MRTHNVFYRYKYIKDALDKVIKSKLEFVESDLPYISKSGGLVDREKLIKLIQT
jgi:hypothetical protein